MILKLLVSIALATPPASLNKFMNKYNSLATGQKVYDLLSPYVAEEDLNLLESMRQMKSLPKVIVEGKKLLVFDESMRATVIPTAQGIKINGKEFLPSTPINVKKDLARISNLLTTRTTLNVFGAEANAIIPAAIALTIFLLAAAKVGDTCYTELKTLACRDSYRLNEAQEKCLYNWPTDALNNSSKILKSEMVPKSVKCEEGKAKQVEYYATNSNKVVRYQVNSDASVNSLTVTTTETDIDPFAKSKEFALLDNRVSCTKAGIDLHNVAWLTAKIVCANPEALKRFEEIGSKQQVRRLNQQSSEKQKAG